MWFVNENLGPVAPSCSSVLGVWPRAGAWRARGDEASDTRVCALSRALPWRPSEGMSRDCRDQLHDRGGTVQELPLFL